MQKKKPKNAGIYKSKSTLNAKPWIVKYYDGDNRKSKSFALKSEAEDFVRKLPSNVVATASGNTALISESDRTEFIVLNQLASEKGMRLSQLAGFIRENMPRLTAFSELPLSALRDKFIAEQTRLNKRPSTIGEHKLHLKHLCNDLGENATLENCTTQRMKEHILSCKLPRYRLKVCNAFFNYCVREDYLYENPLKKVRHILPHEDKKKVEFLTPEETRIIFRHTSKEEHAAYALMLFCGVRPHEIIPTKDKDILQWEDIDFQNKTIYISAKVAKTRTPRHITAAPSNVWTWLEETPKEKRKGNVYPNSQTTYRRGRRAMPTKLPTDVYRHSFGTYGFYFLGIQTTIEIMGHIGRYKVYQDHYKGFGNETTAREYFNIRPDNLNGESGKAAAENPLSALGSGVVIRFEDIIKNAQ